MTTPFNALEDWLRDALAAGDDFQPASSVCVLQIEGRFALFHERRQELVELNATAAVIWRRLEGRSLSYAATALVEDFGPELALPYLLSAAAEWIKDGWMTPAAVVARLSGAPDDGVGLSVLGVEVRLNAFNCALPREVVEGFESLAGCADGTLNLNIVAAGAVYFLFVGQSQRGVFDSETLMPGIKATLTALLSQTDLDGFLAHGALIEQAGRRAFILGEPGAGKSTLSAALASSGLSVLSDDIVQIHDGRCRGAPFPITLKTGSWALLETALPEIATLPIYRRGDGQSVRYLAGYTAQADWAPLDRYVALDRQSGAAAKLTPCSALAAMQSLLASSYAAAGRISVSEIAKLGQAFSEMRSYVLVYCDLAEAVGLIDQVLDDQG